MKISNFLILATYEKLKNNPNHCSFLGVGACCISSFPHIWNEDYPKENCQFYLALIGHIASEIGLVFIQTAITKVSINKTLYGVNCCQVSNSFNTSYSYHYVFQQIDCSRNVLIILCF